ncbi:MAG: O-antigen ligase family protein [Elusimicrobiaceae bacterium]
MEQIKNPSFVLLAWWLALAVTGGGFSGDAAGAWLVAGFLPLRIVWWVLLGAGLWFGAAVKFFKVPDMKSALHDDGALVLFLLWACAASVLSREPALSFEQFSVWATGALFYFAAKTSFTEEMRERFFRVLIAVAYGAALAALAAALFWKIPVREAVFVFPSNINYTACLIAAGLAAAFSMFFEPEYPDEKKYALGLFWLVALAALVLMRSRSALLALSVGCAVVLAMRERHKSFLALLLGIAVFTVVVPSGWIGYLAKTDDPFAFRRLDIWKAAFDTVRENYLFGVGPGRFERSYFLHAFPVFDGFTWYARYTGSAHSQILQFAAETGIAGAFFFLWFVLGSFFRNGRKSPQIKTAASFAALLVAAFFTEAFALPLLFLSLMLLAAISGPLKKEATSVRAVSSVIDKLRDNMERKRVPVLVTAGLVLWLCAGTLSVYRGRLSALPADTASGRKIENALKLYPYDPDLYFRLAQCQLAAESANPVRAVSFLETASEFAPFNAVYFYQRGRILAALGDSPGAEAALRKALYFEPNSPAAAFALAEVYFKAGMSFRARAVLDLGRKNTLTFAGFHPVNLYQRTLFETSESLLNSLKEME